MEKHININKIIKSYFLKKYDLKFTGFGVEKICFETKSNTKKLIKIDIHFLRQKILKLLLANEKHEVVPTGPSVKEKIDEYKKQEQLLVKIFGNKHVMKKSWFRFIISISKEIATIILKENQRHFTNKLNKKDVFKVETLAETQLIAKELKYRDKYQTLSFNVQLLANNDFINSKNISSGLKKIETLVENKLNTDIQEWSNRKFLETIKEIVEKAIKYSKKTGLMIDLFGMDNITIFINENGISDFHLLDAIMPGSSKRYWKKNIKDDKNLTLLIHYYTYYYSVNYLTKKLNIDSSLKPEDLIYFKDIDIPTGEFPGNKIK